MKNEIKHDTNQSISRSSLHFFSGTLLSRISGMVRDMSMAYCFGTVPAVGAFWAGYRLANLFRRVLGEGSLTMGFIPHYEALRKESPKEAAFFFRDLMATIVLTSFILIGVGETILSFFPSTQVVELTMIMLPGLLFICLFALFAAFLQCQRKFLLTGIAPVSFNLVWIASVFFVYQSPVEQAVYSLSFLIVGAFLIQWFMLLPESMRFLLEHLSWKDWFSARFFSPRILTMLKSLTLTVIGVGAVQLNSAIDAIVVRFASLEGPAYLTYAIRIYQVPLALFAIAISSASLPPLSRAFVSKRYEDYLQLLKFTISRTLSFIIPCSFALLVLGALFVNLIFGRGQFGSESVIHTTVCLWGYGIGLIPAALVVLLAPAFYAIQETKTPVISSLISVGCNIFLNLLFVFGFGWGSFSVAFSTSIAAYVNFFFLVSKLSIRVGPIFVADLRSTIWKVCAAGFLSTLVTAWIAQIYFNDPLLGIISGNSHILMASRFWDQLIQCLILSSLFVCSFFCFSLMIGAQGIKIFSKNEIYND